MGNSMVILVERDEADKYQPLFATFPESYSRYATAKYYILHKVSKIYIRILFFTLPFPRNLFWQSVITLYYSLTFCHVVLYV